MLGAGGDHGRLGARVEVHPPQHTHHHQQHGGSSYRPMRPQAWMLRELGLFAGHGLGPGGENLALFSGAALGPQHGPEVAA